MIPLAIVISAVFALSPGPSHVPAGSAPGGVDFVVVVDLATGERRFGWDSREGFDQWWGNTDFYRNAPPSPPNPPQSVSYLTLEDPGRDFPAPFGTEAVDWGDVDILGAGDEVARVGLAYVADLPAGTLPSLPGFSVVVTLYDRYDGGGDAGRIARVAGQVRIDDAPTGRVFISVVIPRESRFTLGAPEEGRDLDGDSLADFGWSYRFEQNQPSGRGIAGPILVLPGNAGGDGFPPSAGVRNRFDWFAAAPFEGFHGAYWFGGFPYASFYLSLARGRDTSECRADVNGDGVVDFFDYLDFVQWFAADDPRADFDENGQVDFFDYLEFIEAFNEPCG